MKVAILALVAVVPAVTAQVPSASTLRRAPPVVSTPARPTPPPVMIRTGPVPPPSQLLFRWMPGEVRCTGGGYPAAAVRRPYTGVGWAGATITQPRTLSFRIDAGGRPLGIAAEGQGYAPWSEDIAPSLASTRFPAGAERDGCRVTYTLQLQSFADADREDLVSQSLTRIGSELPREAWDRIKPAGATCGNAPRPQWLVHVQPDMAKIPAQPGARDWTLVGYDLDADGRPVRVRTAGGTRNPALDKAALHAIAQSRQTGGPRTGCLNPYLRRADPLPAPAIPDTAALRETACGRGEWARPLNLTYPEAWRRRGIEGWAVIGFDVAPWGATGNVRVLAAEPAAEFGERAAQIIRGATVMPSDRGTVDCVEKVKFRMGPDGDVPGDPPLPSSIID